MKLVLIFFIILVLIIILLTVFVFSLSGNKIIDMEFEKQSILKNNVEILTQQLKDRQEYLKKKFLIILSYPNQNRMERHKHLPNITNQDFIDKKTFDILNLHPSRWPEFVIMTPRLLEDFTTIPYGEFDDDDYRKVIDVSVMNELNVNTVWEKWIFNISNRLNSNLDSHTKLKNV
jgi:hypothetical protein